MKLPRARVLNFTLTQELDGASGTWDQSNNGG